MRDAFANKGRIFWQVARTLALGLPLSRPMPSVGPGVHELRVGDATKTARIFYFVKYENAILVFHAFEKRTQKTPPHEIELGKKRLKELLYG